MNRPTDTARVLKSSSKRARDEPAMNHSYQSPKVAKRLSQTRQYQIMKNPSGLGIPRLTLCSFAQFTSLSVAPTFRLDRAS